MKTANRSKSIKALAIGVIAALGIGIAGSASAATPWERHEARQAQIHRFHQDQRINYLERTGRITHWQARQMHRDVHGGYYGHRQYGYGYGRGVQP